jgi:glycosyltransferase involved in cell wall biosynthesis
MYLRSEIPYVSSIHDAVSHPGDVSAPYRLCLAIELRFASVIVAYSRAVRLQLQTRDPRLIVGETVLGAMPREQEAGVERYGTARKPSTVWNIGMLGRLNAYQGVDTFAAAIRILQGRNLKVRGSVFGRGDASVEALSARYPEIEWNLGWVAESEVNRVVNSFDILALPYKESSQSGVASLAMAEGVPMVATPVGGLVEQMNDSGAGILSRSSRAEDFADAVQRLIEEPGLHAELTKNGRLAATTKYTWSRTAEDLSGMFDELIQ